MVYLLGKLPNQRMNFRSKLTLSKCLIIMSMSKEVLKIPLPEVALFLPFSVWRRVNISNNIWNCISRHYKVLFFTQANKLRKIVVTYSQSELQKMILCCVPYYSKFISRVIYDF